MAKFGKWIGGGLGFVVGGPIGGVIGFLFGSLVDSVETVRVDGRAYKKTASPGDYAMSLLVLVAAVLKADGKVMRSELEYVKKFLNQNFGQEGAQEALTLLKDLLKQEIPVDDVAQQIAQNIDYSSRLQLIHFLYGLANVDGKLHPTEEHLIERIAYHMGINIKDRESISSMFRNTVEDLYKILEIEPTATDEEVKKAYRKMAVKYHPDKVAYLGEDVKKAANEKFQALNAAYEKIKKQRGLA